MVEALAAGMLRWNDDEARPIRASRVRLKSAHIRHFKRFVDLTIRDIPPDAKLVVLLGPNGCGKSSLFDAFQRHLKVNQFLRYA